MALTIVSFVVVSFVVGAFFGYLMGRLYQCH